MLVSARLPCVIFAASICGCVTRSEMLGSLDRDGDGWYHGAAAELDEAGPFDCDDDNAAVNPGAAETCDGVDNDCSGSADDVANTAPFFVDADADGYGDPASQQTGCRGAGNFADRAGDCDDDDAGVSPDADEECNGFDDDCDGESDESGELVTWYPDGDADGYGRDEPGVDSCSPPEGYASRSGDCDDVDASVYPGADDAWYDGRDSDCDGWDDYDADRDGVRSEAYGGADCDDADSDVSPEAEETCENGRDDDCDGAPGPCAVPADVLLSGADAVIEGESSGDGAGWALAALGDADGDGSDEILVGAPYDDDGGADAGAVYVVSGPVAGTLSLSSAVKVTGNLVGISLGASVSGAGDLDADGVPDIAAAASDSASTSSGTGVVYLVAGNTSGGSLVTAFGTILGEASGDGFGGLVSGNAYRGIAGPGDMNGDGDDDLIVGASGAGSFGRAYVFFGPLSGSSTASDASVVLEGADSASSIDRLGEVVAAAGEVDGDGLPDAVVVDYLSGVAYLISDPVAGTQTISDVAVAITAENGADGISYGISDASAAGDVDGDGHDDLVIGSALADPGGSDSGAAYVVLGRVWADMPLSAADAILVGEAASDWAGFDVSGAADLNGDGFHDVIVGAPYADGTGATYAIYGPVSGIVGLTGADVRASGVSAADGAGVRIGAADVDGDGYSDLLAAASGADGVGADAGAVYVVLGTGW